MTRQTPDRRRKHTASDVAIVVPVGGGGQGWRQCARALAALDPRPGQLVVVVDGPNQALEAIGRNLGATVLVLDERGGPARARNRAVAAVELDVIAFVDADVVVPSDFASRIAELFDNDTTTAVIGSYDDEPGDPGFFSQYRNLLHHWVHQQGRAVASTFWSGCGAVRRSAFLEVGGFNEGFGEPSIEDIEFGGRLIEAGHTILLVKNLQVKHLKTLDARHHGRHRSVPPRHPLDRGHARSLGLINDLNVKTTDRLSVAAAFLLPICVVASFFQHWVLTIASVPLLTIVLLNRAFSRCSPSPELRFRHRCHPGILGLSRHLRPRICHRRHQPPVPTSSTNPWSSGLTCGRGRFNLRSGEGPEGGEDSQSAQARTYLFSQRSRTRAQPSTIPPLLSLRNQP